MKIVIAGGGIAGMTLAYWLVEQGHAVNIIEKAPGFDRKGFLIGIRGPSVTVLKRMNLLDKALALAMDSIPHDILNSKGWRINRSTYLSYKESEFGKLPLNRADLHAVLDEAIKDRVEICFGTQIEAVEQYADHVEVQLNTGKRLTADLLIGADGVHSDVRRLVFGDGFEQVLNASYAAFVSPKTRPIESVVQFAKGRMSVVYDLNEREFGGIFVVKGQDFANLAPREQKAALMDGQPSQIANALAAVSEDTHLFVDRLTQIAMTHWVCGRVALVGDAAYGLSPASGFGATASIAGAYILAEEIGKSGMAGLERYEQRMRPAIEKKRKSSASTVRQIVTENRIMIAVRDILLGLMPEKATHKARAVEDFGIG